MIREIGGTAEAFTVEDAASLALKLQSLVHVPATHTIIIGIVPTSPPAPRWTRNASHRPPDPLRLI